MTGDNVQKLVMTITQTAFDEEISDLKKEEIKDALRVLITQIIYDIHSMSNSLKLIAEAKINRG